MDPKPDFSYLPKTQALSDKLGKKNPKKYGVWSTALALVGFFVGFAANGKYGFIYIIVAVLCALLSFWFFIKRWSILNEALRVFAEENNWHVTKDKTNAGLTSTLFKTGHSPVISDSIEGLYGGLPMGFFSYQYSVGSGKSERTFETKVLTLELPRVLPNIYIDRLKENGYWLGSATDQVKNSFVKTQNTELEGAFGKNFDVYIPKEYEISALTILTPDVMEAINDAPEPCDIEIADNKIYFYFSNQRFDAKTINNIFGSVSFIMQEIYKPLSRTNIYKTDDHSLAHANVETSAKLQVKNTLLTRILISVFILVICYMGFLYMLDIVMNS